MANHQETRRLSAVLMADIAGYTKLIEQDTEGTVAVWQAARADIIDPVIAAHSGRVVKFTGDGFLVEFRTVQDAVKCAIAMQNGLALAPLNFRMGINLGDIIDDGQDIHGEGVNIAARIEALADPGGICISGGVYDQVRHRLDYTYEDMGEHETALHHIKLAMSYSPRHPVFFKDILAAAYHALDDLDQAEEAAHSAIATDPKDLIARLILVSIAVKKNEPDKWVGLTNDICNIDPAFSIAKFSEAQPYRSQRFLEEFVADLHDAGLPD